MAFLFKITQVDQLLDVYFFIPISDKKIKGDSPNGGFSFPATGSRIKAVYHRFSSPAEHRATLRPGIIKQP
ncbi:hypothetical protein [Gibbsiella quercinecans]|uniref:hypothetical protein n=1 Tax=Gibbsiella quercinecans TaxID=929813 RepID=UPI0010537FDD|nr:hypothetical protein [Gibbsiella quercinecans]